MGGILEVAGIPGFLGNQDKLRAQSDAQSAPWRTFVEAWWDKYGNRTGQFVGPDATCG